MALVDDFSSQDTSKWTFSSGATVSAGQLRLANPNSISYIGVTSAAAQDLTGNVASAQLVTVPTQTGSMETYLKVVQTGNANNYYLIGLSGQDFVAYAYTGGAGTLIWDNGAAPTNGTYMRVREASGTTFFETSTDGKTWTQRGTVTNPWAVTSVSFQILIGHFSNSNSENSIATTAVWDNFNVLPLTASDTGAGVDTATVNTATLISGSDTGSGVDAATIAATAPGDGDTGSGVDAIVGRAFTRPADPWQSSEAASTVVITSASDTASAVDAVTRSVRSGTAADTGSGTDVAVSIVLGSSDTAHGTEATSVAASSSRSDTATASESIALAASATSAETGSAADFTPALGRDVHDAGSSSEATASSFSFTPADSLWLTDTSSSAGVFQRTPPTDSAGMTETLALDQTLTNLSDTAVSGDDSVVLRAGYVRDAGTDVLPLADPVTTAADLQRPFAVASTGLGDQGVTFTQGYGRVSADTVAMSDSVAFDVTSSVLDSAGLDDASSTVTAYAPASSDVAGLADVAAQTWDYGRAAGDPAGLRDTVSFDLTFTVREVATPAEALVAGKGYALTLVDAVAATDALSYGYGRALTDPAGLVDVATGLRVVNVAETASAVDTAFTTKVSLDFHRIGLMVDVHEDDPVMRVGVHRGS